MQTHSNLIEESIFVVMWFHIPEKKKQQAIVTNHKTESSLTHNFSILCCDYSFLETLLSSPLSFFLFRLWLWLLSSSPDGFLEIEARSSRKLYLIAFLRRKVLLAHTKPEGRRVQLDDLIWLIQSAVIKHLLFDNSSFDGLIIAHRKVHTSNNFTWRLRILQRLSKSKTKMKWNERRSIP